MHDNYVESVEFYRSSKQHLTNKMVYEDKGDDVFKTHMQKTIKEYEQMLTSNAFRNENDKKQT